LVGKNGGSMNREKKLPNLFIIGAMKSGTTYLHDLLSFHPDIFMSSVKEPCYFVEKNELKRIAPSMWNMGIWKSSETYLNLFNESKGEKYRGESSTLYTYFPLLQNVPERIYEFNPNARLIYLIRNPLERTLSHFWHDVRVESVFQDPSKILEQGSYYLDISNYALQIKQYLRFFPKENIHVCTFERLTSNPMATLQDIFRWLEISENVSIPNTDKPKNVTPNDIYVSKYNVLPYSFRSSNFVSKVRGLIPYRIIKYLRALTQKKIDKKSIDMSGVIEQIKPLQKQQVSELRSLIGGAFEEWDFN
jgi:hypothetical protein